MGVADLGDRPPETVIYRFDSPYDDEDRVIINNKALNVDDLGDRIPHPEHEQYNSYWEEEGQIHPEIKS